MLALSIALMAGLPAAVEADTLNGAEMPVPRWRPSTSVSPASPVEDPVIAPSMESTASIARVNNPAAISGSLKQGLDAIGSRDIRRALAIRRGMPSNALDRHILTWAIALSGADGVPSGEIAAAANTLEGWPGLGVLRANSERALAREEPPASVVVAAFGRSPPETAEGAMVLTHALMAMGERNRARTTIARLWRDEALDSRTESKILAAFSGLLTKADHLHRMEMLLYRDRATQAKKISELANAQSLYRAWTAIVRRQSNATELIAKVHPMWHDDPGYRFVRISDLRNHDRYEEAAQLLLARPHGRDVLINPGQWWDEQRIVSRGLMEKGDYKTAYRVARDNAAVRPVDVVDADFHAGWYALRGLDDPATAERHFKALVATAEGPLSLSRGYYWLGRAAEAGAPGSHAAYYRKAAAYPATFYGQLAAARIGQSSLSVAYPSPSDAERARFAGREAVRAIKRLQDIGYEWRADTLYRGLAHELTSPGELAILTAMAERRDDDRLSLQIGKIAYGRGVDCAALAFPTGAIPGNADIAGSGTALAYAIARQESAFNRAAVSPANARGLLQLLPTTASRVAARHGLAYSKGRLTTDAGYNATLGAHYLGEQISDFGGSYILTFIAYNAGPRRVPQWIARFGDPRGRSIDEVVDWIERIPFTETRNYVQRIIENYEVYKVRLNQQADIVDDLRFGRS